jgi:hypothetical protein
MAVAALVISIVALLASVASAIYTRTNAVAMKGVHKIERERRLQERRPRLAGVIQVGSPPGAGSAGDGTLKVTLESDEPLGGLEVAIEPGCGVSFSKHAHGAREAPKGEPALTGFAYDHDGNHAGVRAHDSMSWAVEILEDRKARRLDAVCHGAGGEKWSVVVDAPVKPNPVEYIR